MDPNQIQRDTLLFELYPDIQKGGDLTKELRSIFENTKDKIIVLPNLSNGQKKSINSALSVSTQSQEQ